MFDTMKRHVKEAKAVLDANWTGEMSRVILFFTAILFLALILGCSQQVKGPEKARVQAAMKVFIDERLESSGGVYPIKGAIAEFDYLHDGVGSSDGLFVSCADFRAGSDVYDIDYYVMAENGEYTVVKEVLHKKNSEPVNEVLWRAGR